MPAWFNPHKQPLIFALSQAEGVGFDPSNKRMPFVFGSLRDFLSHVSADQMLQYVSKRHEWIKTYCHKVANNEDFTLDELIEAGRKAGFRARPWKGDGWDGYQRSGWSPRN